VFVDGKCGDVLSIVFVYVNVLFVWRLSVCVRLCGGLFDVFWNVCRCCYYWLKWFVEVEWIY